MQSFFFFFLYNFRWRELRQFNISKIFLRAPALLEMERLCLCTDCDSNNKFCFKDRATELQAQREERARRAEEAGLEILHRASGSSYRRSAADIRRSYLRQLHLDELRFPVVAPPSSPANGAKEEDEQPLLQVTILYRFVQLRSFRKADTGIFIKILDMSGIELFTDRRVAICQ